MRTTIAAALLLAVLTSACRGTDREPSKDLGSQPLSLGEGEFICAAEYAGYDGSFYPPNHPAAPPKSVRPARCFNSDVEPQGRLLTCAHAARR